MNDQVLWFMPITILNVVFSIFDGLQCWFKAWVDGQEGLRKENVRLLQKTYWEALEQAQLVPHRKIMLTEFIWPGADTQGNMDQRTEGVASMDTQYHCQRLRMTMELVNHKGHLCDIISSDESIRGLIDTHSASPRYKFILYVVFFILLIPSVPISLYSDHNLVIDLTWL